MCWYTRASRVPRRRRQSSAKTSSSPRSVVDVDAEAEAKTAEDDDPPEFSNVRPAPLSTVSSSSLSPISERFGSCDSSEPTAVAFVALALAMVIIFSARLSLRSASFSSFFALASARFCAFFPRAAPLGVCVLPDGEGDTAGDAVGDAAGADATGTSIAAEDEPQGRRTTQAPSLSPPGSRVLSESEIYPCRPCVGRPCPSRVAPAARVARICDVPGRCARLRQIVCCR